jgi:hypothetical protein
MNARVLVWSGFLRYRFDAGMREELPDGRPAQAAIALGTFLVLSSGAALAQDQLSTANLVQLVVTLGVYDNRCEKLAPGLLADV